MKFIVLNIFTFTLSVVTKTEPSAAIHLGDIHQGNGTKVK